MSTSRITPSPSNFIPKSFHSEIRFVLFFGSFSWPPRILWWLQAGESPTLPTSFSFPMGGKLAVDASGPLAQQSWETKERPIRNWTWKWCSNWKCKVTRIYHMCWCCVDTTMMNDKLHYMRLATCSSCTFLIISVFISTYPEVPHLTILTHTHTQQKTPTHVEIIEYHYSTTLNNYHPPLTLSIFHGSWCFKHFHC